MKPQGTKKIDISSDDSVVNLKKRGKEAAGFKVSKIEDDSLGVFGATSDSFSDIDPAIISLAERITESGPRKKEDALQEPKEFVKVKFSKFVQLVASRDFFGVLEKNADEDIVISSNLLTELAGAVDQKSEKKTPVIFLVGLAIGVVITYILISK